MPFCYPLSYFLSAIYFLFQKIFLLYHLHRLFLQKSTYLQDEIYEIQMHSLPVEIVFFLSIFQVFYHLTDMLLKIFHLFLTSRFQTKMSFLHFSSGKQVLCITLHFCFLPLKNGLPFLFFSFLLCFLSYIISFFLPDFF